MKIQIKHDNFKEILDFLNSKIQDKEKGTLFGFSVTNTYDRHEEKTVIVNEFYAYSEKKNVKVNSEPLCSDPSAIPPAYIAKEVEEEKNTDRMMLYYFNARENLASLVGALEADEDYWIVEKENGKVSIIDNLSGHELFNVFFHSQKELEMEGKAFESIVKILKEKEDAKIFLRGAFDHSRLRRLARVLVNEGIVEDWAKTGWALCIQRKLFIGKAVVEVDEFDTVVDNRDAVVFLNSEEQAKLYPNTPDSKGFQKFLY